MKNKSLIAFLKNNKEKLLATVIILACIVITLVFCYNMVDSMQGLNSEKAALLKISYIVITALVLLITLLNIRSARKREAETHQKLVISDTLISCITVLATQKNISIAMDNLLKILNDHFEGDRAYLFEFDFEKQTTSNSYEYATEGVTKEIDKLQDIPISVIDSWIRKFEETGMFYITSLGKDVDKESDAYAILEMQQIQSLIAVPLVKDDVIIGFLGIDNPKVNYDNLTLLSSATFFILDGIDRREKHALLKRLSFEDTLTGVFNRNRFNRVVYKMHTKPQHNLGVAFFDINDLKKTNDTLGHEAGDNLIINSAAAIKEIFPESTFRIGGDEFVTFAYETEEAQFNRLVDDTVEALHKRSISVSVGAVWCETCDDIDTIIAQADALMYEKKQDHHAQTD